MLLALYLWSLLVTIQTAHPERQVYCHVVLNEPQASEDYARKLGDVTSAVSNRHLYFHLLRKATYYTHLPRLYVHRNM